MSVDKIPTRREMKVIVKEWLSSEIDSIEFAGCLLSEKGIANDWPEYLEDEIAIQKSRLLKILNTTER